MSVDVPSLLTSLGRWEIAEYAACAVVFLGVLGEAIASRFKDETRKTRLARFSEYVLLAGLAGEFAGLINAAKLTGQIIEALNENAITAGQAATAAENDAVQARLEIARLQKENASLRKEAEDERLARVQLQTAITPHLLSSKEQKEITEACRPFAGTDVRVLVMGTIGDAWQLAIQVAGALRDAGFTVDLQPYGGVWYNLEISGPKEHLDIAEKLGSIVAVKAKIPIVGVLGVRPDGSPIRLVIGERTTGALPKIARPPNP
jgi:hypothetical protein